MCMYPKKKLTTYIKEQNNEESISPYTVTVKLRKSEYHDEWYLYIEAYPVFQSGKDKPQRLREYLNRTITTPVFDKSRNARTGADGKTTYKPKRDLNGIIVCKSQLDQEACIYADKVRSMRQRNTITLHSIRQRKPNKQNSLNAHAATLLNTLPM